MVSLAFIIEAIEIVRVVNVEEVRMAVYVDLLFPVKEYVLVIIAFREFEAIVTSRPSSRAWCRLPLVLRELLQQLLLRPISLAQDNLFVVVFEEKCARARNEKRKRRKENIQF